MKRRSLLGALLGLPAGAALGATTSDEALTAGILRIARESKDVQHRPHTWRPVEPTVRHGNVVLYQNEEATFRWMRARRGVDE